MAKKTAKRKVSDDVEDIKEIFEACEDAWSEHHNRYRTQYRFNRTPHGNEQWTEDAKRARGTSRPMLTVNKLNPIITQIINDCRQNKPAIKVRAADDFADPDTAEIYSGLIRNIEQISNADAAYDTAVDNASSGGFGFLRVRLDYAYDDSFDLDILIDRVANPLSVYGDPYSTAVDSSDWEHAFITDVYSAEQFKSRWPDHDPVSWDGDEPKSPIGDQAQDDIQVAEYWCRKEVPKTILKLSNGVVLGAAEYEAQRDILDAAGITVVGQREIKSCRVYQKILNGAEIMEEHDWPGKYIPIIPVYGTELNDEGRRMFLSATYYAFDAQRKYNYWTTTSTELVALAPKAPYIGPETAFQGEYAERWTTANTENHPFLAYKGAVAPQRQPIDSGPAAGAMQEAMVAADEIKAATGVYDASLGARSNETSGRAINARKVEGDTATFHFTDNLARGIRHCGRILIDLIPKVYTQERMVRVLGDDGQAQAVRLGAERQPTSEQPKGHRKTFDGIYDLSVGKYDLVVDTGPSYTTRRVETREEIMALIQAAPDVAGRVADILAKNMDWKDADLIAERLAPPDAANIPPEVQQQIEMGKQMISDLTQERDQLKQSQLKDMASLEKARTDKETNEVKRLELALERDRLPLEEMQKQIELLTAKIGLVNAEASAKATVTQAGAEANARSVEAGAAATNADSLGQFAEAARQLSEANAATQALLANLQETVSRPRSKRGRAVKQRDGSWAMETIEAA